jgi:hypothetical protein
MANPSKPMLAQFKSAVHSSRFLLVKTTDDNQIKFIPQLAIDIDFFHFAFANPCTM